MQDIHIFIFKVGAMKGVDVSLKYLKLTALAKCVLCISHGNSDSERGFSLNKTLLCVHGASIGEETIEAVRFVKNVIIRNGGLANIQVPRSLIRSSHNARQWYESYLVEKRRLEEEEKEKIKRKIAESQQKEHEKTSKLSVILINWKQVWKLQSKVLLKEIMILPSHWKVDV